MKGSTNGNTAGSPDNYEIELTIVMPCLNEAVTLEACIRQAARFLAEHNVNFPTYRDTTAAYPAIGNIAKNYGTAMLPEVYLITRDGRIARKIVGQQDWMSPEITSALDALLRSN